MTTRTSETETTTSGVIRDWQGRVSPECAPEQDWTIAKVVVGCLELFKGLLNAAQGCPWLSTRSKALLRRQLETFKLWVDGHGALGGDLDSILHRSPNLQHTTLVALNALCGNLIHGTFKSLHFQSPL